MELVNLIFSIIAAIAAVVAIFTAVAIYKKQKTENEAKCEIEIIKQAVPSSYLTSEKHFEIVLSIINKSNYILSVRKINFCTNKSQFANHNLYSNLPRHLDINMPITLHSQFNCPPQKGIIHIHTDRKVFTINTIHDTAGGLLLTD